MGPSERQFVSAQAREVAKALTKNPDFVWPVWFTEAERLAVLSAVEMAGLALDQAKDVKRSKKK